MIEGAVASVVYPDAELMEFSGDAHDGWRAVFDIGDGLLYVALGSESAGKLAKKVDQGSFEVQVSAGGHVTIR